jgi:hypothetical protein
MSDDTYIFEAIEPDKGALNDNSTRRLQELLPGYDPTRDPGGQLLIDAVNSGSVSLVDWASDLLATIAAHVFQVAGVNRTMPSPAAGTVTVETDGEQTRVLEAGATLVGSLPDGTAVVLHVTADTTIEQGTTVTPGVPVEASQDGLLTAIGTPQDLEPDQAHTWLTKVTLDALTAPGSDGEDDDEYLDRGSRRMRNQADMLILPSNVQRFCDDFPGVGRCLVLDLVDATDPANPEAPVDGCVTVVPTGSEGSAPSSTLLTDLKAALQDRRPANDKFFVIPPTYVPLTIELTVAAWADSLDDAGERVEEALRQWLHPGRFAGRGYGWGDGSWEPTATVRVGEVVSVADTVEGVDYVPPELVEIGGANADFVLTAPIAALPDPNNLTITVNVVERTP